MEKVNVASLSIDFNDVIKQSAKYKNEINSIKKAQKELDDTTEAGQLKYIEYEAELKNVKKAYRDNQSFASALSSANKDLEKTMSAENKSTQELRDSRSQLNQISKQIKGDTDEEIAMRDKLNKAIDVQTEAIRNQGSEFNAGKDGIGEYKDNIIEAYSEMKKQEEVLKSELLVLTELREEQAKGSEEWNFYNTQLNQTEGQLNNLVGSYSEMTSEQKNTNDELTASNTLTNMMSGNFKAISEDASSAGGANKLFGSALKGGVIGMWGMVKASIAFIATPVGATIAALVVGFMLIKNAMSRSEETSNKVKKAFSAFSGIIQGLLKILEPLGVFLVDYLVFYFGMVEMAVYTAISVIGEALELLGFEEEAKGMKNFSKEIENAGKQAKQLADAEAELNKVQRTSGKLQLDYKRQAEQIRQERDNEKNSISERIALNEKLGITLQKQLSEELKIARLAVKVVNLRIQAEGKTEETLDAQAQALEKIAEIEERMTSQKSEQLKSLNSLHKESEAKAKEARDKMITGMREEIDLFISQQGTRKKTLEQELELERKITSKKIQILDEELKAKKISKNNHSKQIIDLQNSLAQKEADIVVNNARKELEAYNSANASKLDSTKFLSEAIFNEEKLRFERLAEQRRNFAQIQLDEGKISQQEYNDAINQIDKENFSFQEELLKERKEAEKERKEEEAEAQKERDSIDLENKLAITAENAENEFVARQEVLERERANEILQAEKTGANKKLINEKYNAFEKTIAKDITSFKNQQNLEILSGLKSLFGEGTKLGKAFAIAEIASTTVQNATKAFAQASVYASNPITAPLAISAGIQGGVIVASGVTQTAKVAGIKLEKGGVLKGLLHSQGGIDLGNGYEAEDGEAVINRKSTAMFAPLLSKINEAGGGVKFAKGGILGSTGEMSAIFNYDKFAFMVSEANKSLPSPVVAVSEITNVASKVAVIEDTSTL